MTAPNRKVARHLARKALEAKLVACANIVPAVESLYWWQDKIECSRELLIVFKTIAPRVNQLEKMVVAEHPYDTPEFVVLDPSAANRRYLAWWRAACVG
ncbi:MAG TPA: divalent-cation tolerance protein CutA [Verrucomicrobiae bacterium]|nr:divalent-cation tolerance protein CutA [Verrucomicrobiae bacterium]